MARYVLTPRARADLADIWRYTVQRWDPEQADRYVRDVQRAIETVARDPRKGRRCDDVRAGYLRYPVGSHVVFFRMAGDTAVVVRILHQRMDFARHLT
jgi:toxin ParE1/3/4